MHYEPTMTVEQVLTECTAYALVDLLIQIRLSKSKSKGRRLIQQGCISINGTKVTDPDSWLFVNPNRTGFYQLGIDRSKLHDAL